MPLANYNIVYSISIKSFTLGQNSIPLIRGVLYDTIYKAPPAVFHYANRSKTAQTAN